MHKRLKIPQSVKRNALILALAIVTIVATQVALKSVKAQPGSAGSRQQENIYLKVLHGDYNSADAEERRMMSVGDDADRLVYIYHKRMNAFFNEKIRLIVKQEKLEDMIKLVSPPAMEESPTSPPKRAPCGDKNASTYCLSQKGTKEYFDFREALVTARGEASAKAAENMARTNRSEGGAKSPLIGAAGDLLAGSKSINAYAATLQKIDREIEIARQALDQSLATYNEFQTALPLHKKYVELLTILGKYRDKISKIRRNVDQYPDTFLNVTTTSCI